MSVDRSWMSKRVVRGLLTEEFNRDVFAFLDFAFSNEQFVWNSTIKCPCSRCKLRAFGARSEVRLHLLKNGFTPHYTLWDQHGKRREHHRAALEQPDPSSLSNPFVDLVMDTGGFEFDTREHDETADELPNPNAKKFYDLLKDAEEPLWNGCKKHTKLSMITRLMNVKSNYGQDPWTEEPHDFHEDATTSTSRYSTKSEESESPIHFTAIRDERRVWRGLRDSQGGGPAADVDGDFYGLHDVDDGVSVQTHTI
ncbi:Transpos_assoc domain-containing protein [Cephalotus follicularis]|uniref:Transpos_assoc domain-containing protein n=1 Tax=Cephalotus follicularis TaxID=3775 RepID=A0A1Q3AXW6_CEPFO|nr:Transpos_assoc domain-containing protein [Cephalotus follicularis]